MADLPHAVTDPLSGLLGYQLRRASVVMMADLAEVLAPLGLRPSESTTLLTIGANPTITQSELGRHLGIKRANMTPLTASLVARGLIDRTPVDGRSHGLRLTAAGAALAEEARAAIGAHEQRFRAALGGTAQAPLIAALAAIRAIDPDRGE
ncbi:MAG: MarR family transcriptional regulator [Sphingomonas fennica]